MANANEDAHQKLTAVAEAVSSVTGEKAFERLVSSVAKILKADFVLIGELAPTEKGLIRTLAFCKDGEITDNFDYNIIGAPCENVVGKEICVYQSGVQQTFAEDVGLKNLGVQSYVGIPLFDPAGVPLGLIVMMNREPIDKASPFRDLLNILANRAAAELYRQKIEAQLVQAQKMEAVGQLTGGMAHDFNNILGIILGNLEFLEEDLQGDEERLKLVKSAIRAALSGANLNRQLLSFSRKQQLQPKLIDLNDQVQGMLDMLRRTLGATIEIETTQSQGPWTTEVDPAQLESAILNLAVNARDAMGDGGVLKIDTTRIVLDDAYVATRPEVRPGEYVKLSVSDDGVGMSADTLAQAFEPFFTTKDVGKGSGLGLSMVFGFAKQSGGNVDIESAVGDGVTVIVYLPYRPAHQDET